MTKAALRLRVNATSLIYKWLEGQEGLFVGPDIVLSDFCGYTDYNAMHVAHELGDPEVHRKLLLLTGPHGYTAFKAWKAMRGKS